MILNQLELLELHWNDWNKLGPRRHPPAPLLSSLHLLRRLRDSTRRVKHLSDGIVAHLQRSPSQALNCDDFERCLHCLHVFWGFWRFLEISKDDKMGDSWRFLKILKTTFRISIRRIWMLLCRVTWNPWKWGWNGWNGWNITFLYG